MTTSRDSPKAARRGLRRPWLCVAALVGIASVSIASVSTAAPRQVSVTVQAQPRFEDARTIPAGDGQQELRARLLDDTGAPVRGANVSIESSDSRAELSPCDAVGSRAANRDAAFVTDEQGQLCARVRGASELGSVELTFPGSALHLPARAQLSLQAARREVHFAFDAPSIELDLNQPTQRLHLTFSDQAEAFPSIELSLSDAGRERVLEGSEWSRVGNTLAFSISSDQLGAPGPARLVARHAGSDRVAPARAEAVALRVASVRLRAEVLSADASGTLVQVWAETPAGSPTSGWVEALSSAGPVGSGPLKAGSAELHLPPPSDPAQQITLFYRSDDPWWLPGEPFVLSLEGTGVRPPARWPWLVLLAPIGYFCLRSLQRPALRPANKRRRMPVPQAPALRVEPRALVSGWSGTVMDAHEGVPVAGARVEARLPSLRANSPSHVAITDASGYFELAALPHPLPEGARLHVVASLHTEVERALPPQGRVAITMISRRRALLRRLVRWAKALGPPWARSGEPTPGEIANVALRRGDLRTAQWAEGVEAAAFGGVQVDETLEAALRAQEPAWHSGKQSDSREED